MVGSKTKGCAVDVGMRINARLMRSFADREPRCSHKTEDNKKDEEYGECGGHYVYHKCACKLGQLRGEAFPGHVDVGILYITNY